MLASRHHLYFPKVRTNLRMFTFQYTTCKTWEAVPCDLKQLTKTAHLKSQFKFYLLNSQSHSWLLVSFNIWFHINVFPPFLFLLLRVITYICVKCHIFLLTKTLIQLQLQYQYCNAIFGFSRVHSERDQTN